MLPLPHHTRQRNQIGTNFLYSDLEPGGDGQIAYSVCGSPLPVFWADGVEQWDMALPLWEFARLQDCTIAGANTLLQWEDSSLTCADGAVACWVIPWTNSTIHGSHRDFGITWILFDRIVYGGLDNPEKLSGAAHEWGHNLGLADHDLSQCQAGTLMGQLPACFLSPLASDVSSVRCNVYGYCGDFSGDTCTDVLARRSDSVLFMYKGNCAGGWGSGGIQIGSDWNQFTAILRPGDFSGDGCTDVLARRPDGPPANGLLFMYKGNCAGGWGSGGIQIGSGWNQFTAILGPGDFSGDGCDDVIVRRPDGPPANGLLFMYRGNCDGTWGSGGIQIGSDWNQFTAILGPGDFNADGCADVIARRSDGLLFMYKGNCGQGGIWWKDNGVATQIGSGWNGYDWLVGPGDFDGDGCMDVMARSPASNGLLFLYRGNCAGGWSGGGQQIGSGWNQFTWTF